MRTFILIIAAMASLIAMPVMTYACEQVTEYTIEQSSNDLGIKPSRHSFMANINRMIQKGWQPIGGVSIYRIAEHTYYAQAMVKCTK